MGPLVLVAVLAVLGPVQGVEFCYLARWDLANPAGAQQRVIRPVTTWPQGHVLTERTICGQQFTVGDPIPPTGLWSTSGQSSASHSSCKEVSAGALFFAYNFPNRASSNTGMEINEQTLLYFLKDSENNDYFVATYDNPGNSDGGQTRLQISSPSVAGTGVSILLRDDNKGDSASCMSATNDCYAWDSASGTGSFYWRWGTCCTDGMVMGHLTGEYDFNFLYDKMAGINSLAFGSQDNGPILSRVPLELADFQERPIAMSYQTCSQHCAALTSCGECEPDVECGWCDSTQTCLPNSRESECPPADWINEACCPNCATYSDCSSCIAIDGCGWGYDLGQCLSGTSEAGLCQASLFTELGGTCDTPPGAGPNPPETGPTTFFCSGQGTPDFDTNTCTCDPGYFSADCSQECPGGAANPCSGNGVCDTNGNCFCDEGFAGADCSLISHCPTSGGVCFVTTGTACEACGNEVVSGGSSTCTGRAPTSPSDRAVSGSHCSCPDTHWGLDCTEQCPGITAEGEPCGGQGTCSVDDGSCTCDPCFEFNAGSGACELEACPSCQNQGQCTCDAASGNQVCSCPGQWSGPTCTTCNCQNGGVCDSLTGGCNCPADFLGAQCEFQCSRDSLCNGFGTCNATTLECECDADYIGTPSNQCAFHCPPSQCSGHGTCSPSTGLCQCDPGFGGPSCEPLTQLLIEVFEDTDGNNAFGGSEAGVGGYELRLQEVGGGSPDSVQVTTAGGLATFTGILPGDYTLVATSPTVGQGHNEHTVDNALNNTVNHPVHDTLYNTVDNALNDAHDDALHNTVDNALNNTVNHPVHDTLYNPLHDALHYPHDDPFHDAVYNTIHNPLDDPLNLAADVEELARNEIGVEADDPEILQALVFALAGFCLLCCCFVCGLRRRRTKAASRATREHYRECDSVYDALELGSLPEEPGVGRAATARRPRPVSAAKQNATVRRKPAPAVPARSTTVRTKKQAPPFPGNTTEVGGGAMPRALRPGSFDSWSLNGDELAGDDAPDQNPSRWRRSTAMSAAVAGVFGRRVSAVSPQGPPQSAAGPATSPRRPRTSTGRARGRPTQQFPRLGSLAEEGEEDEGERGANAGRNASLAWASYPGEFGPAASLGGSPRVLTLDSSAPMGGGASRSMSVASNFSLPGYDGVPAYESDSDDSDDDAPESLVDPTALGGWPAGAAGGMGRAATMRRMPTLRRNLKPGHGRDSAASAVSADSEFSSSFSGPSGGDAGIGGGWYSYGSAGAGPQPHGARAPSPMRASMAADGRASMVVPSGRASVASARSRYPSALSTGRPSASFRGAQAYGEPRGSVASGASVSEDYPTAGMQAWQHTVRRRGRHESMV